MARIYVSRKPDGSYAVRGERRVGKLLLGAHSATAPTKRDLAATVGEVLTAIGLEGDAADVSQAPASISRIEQ